MECRYKAHDTKDGVRVSEFQYVIFPRMIEVDDRQHNRFQWRFDNIPLNLIVPAYSYIRHSYKVPQLFQTGSATLLQYIGTPHGVMRVYPSYYTPRIGKWVTYDHRFRIW